MNAWTSSSRWSPPTVDFNKYALPTVFLQTILQMSKAVIFDMDGVICHTNPYHAQAFSRFFEKRNLFPTEEEYFQNM